MLLAITYHYLVQAARVPVRPFLRVVQLSFWFQVNNPHNNNLADFQSELPLYERSGALVNFLLKYRQEEGMSRTSSGLTPSQIEGLTVTMFEYGIVEEGDVILTQVGD